jgi:ABC-2 type transport system ATP-binding protein
VADYLVLLSSGTVQVVGEVDDLLATHRVLTGPALQYEQHPLRWDVVYASRGASQVHLFVRGNGTSGPVPPGWEARSVTLEELALAYLREPTAAAFPGPGRRRDADLRVVRN